MSYLVEKAQRRRLRLHQREHGARRNIPPPPFRAAPAPESNRGKVEARQKVRETPRRRRRRGGPR